MIGSLWLPAELRGEIKSRIHALRQRHSAWGEIKWTKVSRNIGKIRAAALWERETCLAALERRGGR